MSASVCLNSSCDCLVTVANSSSPRSSITKNGSSIKGVDEKYQAYRLENRFASSLESGDLRRNLAGGYLISSMDVDGKALHETLVKVRAITNYHHR